MADIKQIEVSGTKYNIAGAAIILEDNGTTVTSATPLPFKAKTDQITSLVDGQIFLYKIPNDIYRDGSAYSATLNITASGTALGAKQIIVGGDNSTKSGSALTVPLIGNDWIMLIYRAASQQFILMNAVPHHLYNISKIYGGYDGSEHIIMDDGIQLKNGYDTLAIFKPNFTKICGGTYDTNLYITYYDNAPDVTFYGDGNRLMRITGTKVLGRRTLQLGACNNDYLDYISSGPRVELTARNLNSGKFTSGNSTKIMLEQDPTSTSECKPQYVFINSYSWTNKLLDGLYMNRPLYLTTPNETAINATSSMSYNATEDCIEFKFE